MDQERLRRAVERGAEFLPASEMEFFQRYWKTDLGVYYRRLRALRFSGMERVLDAGSGMGQWTLCLSQLNGYVCAVDASRPRVEASRAVMRELGVENVEIRQQPLERIDYPSESFDGIFCYSVLYMTDYRKSLGEFARVLKPGGRLYICTNGLGWYLYNLVRAPNQTANYRPRSAAWRTIFVNTPSARLLGRRSPGEQVVTPSRWLKKYLSSLGFDRIAVGGEGTLNPGGESGVRSFYRGGYYGFEGVYEVLAERGEAA